MIVKAFFSHVIFSLWSQTAPAGAQLRCIGETRLLRALFPGRNISWSAGRPRRRFEDEFGPLGQQTAIHIRRSAGLAIYTFDVAPARQVTGLITERGVLQADRDMLTSAFPERPRTAEAPPE
jgi:hypothetical protein